MTEENEGENEIVAAAKEAKAAKKRSEKRDWPNATSVGIGIGIGSAAVVAALLYSRLGRGERDD